MRIEKQRNTIALGTIPKERDDFSEINPTKIQQINIVTKRHMSIGVFYDHNLPLHARPPELPNVLHKSK